MVLILLASSGDAFDESLFVEARVGFLDHFVGTGDKGGAASGVCADVVENFNGSKLKGRAQ